MSRLLQLLLGRDQRNRMSRNGVLFILPATLYFLFVYYYPLFQSFLISFQDWHPGRSPKWAGLKMYQRVLSDPLFWLSVKNTLYFALLSVPIIVGLSLITAILLDRVVHKRIRDLLSTMYFMPLVMSMVAAALIWNWIYHPIYGLFNTILSFVGLPTFRWLNSPQEVIPSLVLINIWLRLGFAIVIFLSALQSLPGEYYEAAQIDGAGTFAAFRHITLPLLNPQIVFVTMVELIFAFRVFDQVYAATQGGPANSSRVIILHLYETAFRFHRMGEASAIAVIFFLFLLFISIIQWQFARRATAL